MAQEVLLPKQGNSVESCIIVEWRKAEGDTVARGEPLVEVETDKATMEVESTADGVLLKRLVKEGDDVPVLSPIAVVGEPGENVDTERPPTATAAEATEGLPRRPATRGANEPSEATGPQGAATVHRRGGTRISPRARKLAATLDVRYDGIEGSGPGGRIMARDIQAAAARPPVDRAGDAPAKGAAAITGGGRTAAAEVAEELPVKGVRKLIAERMHQSLASTAQLTMDASADARALLAYRKRLKSSADPRLSSISINDLMLFVTARVVASTPAVNATFAHGVIRRYRGVDLGFAVDTPKGLMVPVITGADSLSLAALAAEAHRLAEACSAGTVTPDELSGGTFTVTNLGAFGIERFTPVLNAPQVAILGVCSIVERPAADAGEGCRCCEHCSAGPATVPMIGLSLTVDHQVVDGAPAARFLQQVAAAIADIDLTLAG